VSRVFESAARFGVTTTKQLQRQPLYNQTHSAADSTLTSAKLYPYLA
jgi:hypothetical protein